MARRSSDPFEKRFNPKTEMIDSKLLEVRKAVKGRKPNFQIQNSNDPKKRWPGRWKRPKGLQSKMRERRKGNPKYIEPGYGSPAAVRGATVEGLFPVVVRNVSDLGKVKDDEGVIISATVSIRKKAQIAKAAAGRKLKLLNLNAEELAKRLGESMAARKTRRLGLLQKRKIKGEAKKRQPTPTPATTAAASTGDIESKVDEEAKKKAEKAEKDKILITKAK
ncbi:hypothetical protein HYU20_03460 [Candidatus Woesearchaeota archaeon]|nr:hypothetical protein [Candidatus Woesearchaeota archaeon]